VVAIVKLSSPFLPLKARGDEQKNVEKALGAPELQSEKCVKKQVSRCVHTAA
jgi:hypothetical protein